MRKICVIITARPSYSRIKSALVAMKDHKDINLEIILTSSALLEKYGQVSNIIEKDGFVIKDKIFSIIEGDSVENSVKDVGLNLIELSNSLKRVSPDAVMTITDRYETISNAISASYMNIPLIHIQGGEITGSIDNKVRHAITKLADVHLVSTELAKKRVTQMGENPEMVFNTGCPSIDLAHEVLQEKNVKFNPFSYSGIGNTFDHNKDFVTVMQHPVTTEFEDSFDQVNHTLDAVKAIGLPVLWFWPNLDAGSDSTSKAIRVFREKNLDLPFFFIKNMEPKDFLRLLRITKVLIGNSSVGIRESSYIGTPVVNIGSRQNSRERASNVLDTSYEKEEIIKAITKQLKAGTYNSSSLYGSGNSGEKIAEIVSSIDLPFEKPHFY